MLFNFVFLSSTIIFNFKAFLNKNNNNKKRHTLFLSTTFSTFIIAHLFSPFKRRKSASSESASKNTWSRWTDRKSIGNLFSEEKKIKNSNDNMNYQSSITMSTVDDIILLTFSFSPSLELHKTDNHLSIINDCFLSSPFFFSPLSSKTFDRKKKNLLIVKVS